MKNEKQNQTKKGGIITKILRLPIDIPKRLFCWLYDFILRHKKMSIISLAIILIAAMAAMLYVYNQGRFIRELTKKADSGNVESQAALGEIFYLKNNKKSDKYLSMAIGNGHGMALDTEFGIKYESYLINKMEKRLLYYKIEDILSHLNHIIIIEGIYDSFRQWFKNWEENNENPKYKINIYNMALPAAEKGDWLFFTKMGQLAESIKEECRKSESNEKIKNICSKQNKLDPLMWYEKALRLNKESLYLQTKVAILYFPEIEEIEKDRKITTSKENINKALALLHKASERTGASFYLGNMYRLGIVVKKDLNKAYNFYKHSFLLGSEASFNMLAEYFPQAGYNNKSSFCDELMSKAESGIPESQYVIAEGIINPSLVRSCFKNIVSEAKAREYMARSAKQGYLDAIYFFRDEDNLDEFINEKTAASVLKKAEKGDAEALSVLQKIYIGHYKGKFEFITSDYLKKAEKVFDMAFDNSDIFIVSGITEHLMGMLYYYNFGEFFIDSDREKAIKYLNKAYERGYKQAWKTLKEIKAI